MSYSDVTSEQIRDDHARAWRFILECHAKKETAPESHPDAQKEIDEQSGKSIIPE